MIKVNVNIERDHGKKKKNIFVVLVTLLAAILFINVLVLAVRIGSRDSYNTYEYSELKSELDHKDYPNLMQMVKSNEASNHKAVANTEQFSYFVDFYENALLYKAYLDEGETEKAETFLSKAKEKEVLITNDDFDDAIQNVEELYGIK